MTSAKAIKEKYSKLQKLKKKDEQTVAKLAGEKGEMLRQIAELEAKLNDAMGFEAAVSSKSDEISNLQKDLEVTLAIILFIFYKEIL